jgi:hypothetical protein
MLWSPFCADCQASLNDRKSGLDAGFHGGRVSSPPYKLQRTTYSAIVNALSPHSGRQIETRECAGLHAHKVEYTMLGLLI